ncbi:MAG TPA: TIGR02996 domain-containing protein [Gemmataceae bacterium]|nr:TIGR02996 domain-containing protein [Gemmataceae bacterium]
MTDREALLVAALGEPADDTARLVLADYLEENGEPDLGRFVRTGVTAARFRVGGPAADHG